MNMEGGYEAKSNQSKLRMYENILSELAAERDSHEVDDNIHKEPIYGVSILDIKKEITKLSSQFIK